MFRWKLLSVTDGYSNNSKSSKGMKIAKLIHSDDITE